MRVGKSKVVLFLISILFLSFAEVSAEEESGTEKISATQMKTETLELLKSVQKIEKRVEEMNREAVRDKDIKWKVCLDDVLVSLKGIVASVTSARYRMIDLLNIDRVDAARSQFILIRGLSDSAEKYLTEAYACQKQVARTSERTTVELSENKEETGTFGEEGNVNEAMGQGFSDDFLTEKGQESTAVDDTADAGGTDQIGGPTDTPESEGGISEDNEEKETEVTTPPDVVVSRET